MTEADSKPIQEQDITDNMEETMEVNLKLILISIKLFFMSTLYSYTYRIYFSKDVTCRELSCAMLLSKKSNMLKHYLLSPPFPRVLVSGRGPFPTIVHTTAAEGSG